MKTCKTCGDRTMWSEDYDYEAEIKSLKADLHQQKFNNKHNLSIDGVIADKIEKMRAALIEIRSISKRSGSNPSTPMGTILQISELGIGDIYESQCTPMDCGCENSVMPRGKYEK